MRWELRRRGSSHVVTAQRLERMFTLPRGPLERAMFAGLYKVVDRVKYLVERRSTIGRKIWRATGGGRGKSNLGHFVKPDFVQRSGMITRGALKVIGLVALLEAGGKTAPHEILPKGRGRRLRRRGSAVRVNGRRLRGSGEGVLALADGTFRPAVWHHTATIRPHRFAETAIGQSLALMRQFMERALGAEADRITRKAS